jgi:hypothetical protein
MVPDTSKSGNQTNQRRSHRTQLYRNQHPFQTGRSAASRNKQGAIDSHQQTRISEALQKDKYTVQACLPQSDVTIFRKVV